MSNARSAILHGFGNSHATMNDNIETPPTPYWMLFFIVNHGGWLAIATGLLPLLASVVAVTCGMPVWMLAIGVISSALLFILMRSFVELVRVIVEMLLPK